MHTPRPELVAALAYAARGWHVIPITPGAKAPAFPTHDQDTCTRTEAWCHRAGRHVTWEERATTDPTRITRCWTGPVPYGVGIACGPSGLVVIDPDVPKDDQPWPDQWRIPGITCGMDVLAHLARTLGQTITPTYTVATPTGGRHLYYRAPAEPGGAIRNSVGTANGPLGWLVDVRAHGGQVVAPPTHTVDGAYTVIDDRDPTPLPAWQAERLRPTPAPTGSATARLRGTRDPWTPASRRERYLSAAIDRETTRVRDAVTGGRNHALFIAACALGQLVAGGELNDQYVRAVLLDASAAHFTDPGYPRAQAGRTITSGLRRGANRPRRLSEAA